MRFPKCVRLAFVLLPAALAASCDGSREKLLVDLQGPRAQDRALAVRKLADQGKPEDLVLFTRAAKDLASIVRGEAAVALGKSQDPRVVDLLGELLEDEDEDVQAKAATALAQFKNEKSRGYLTIQYARRGRSTRLAIVQALKTSNIPGAMAQVVAAEAQGIWDRNLRALTEGSMPERVAAAEELGKSGRAEAVNRLMPLTKDSQVILAAAAVRGLGYTGDARTVAPIAQLLNENFPEIRDAACEALIALQDPQALPTLKSVALEKSAGSALATTAIAALPRSPDTDRALCEIALGGDAQALRAGREVRNRGGCPVDPIVERLTQKYEVAQALVAARALGPLAKPAAAKVIPFLSSSDRATRALALDAAIEIGDPSAGPAVQKLYEQELGELESVRADWIRQPLPKKYAPGFAPDSELLPSAGEEDHDSALKQQDLFKRVEEANAARAQAAGKIRIQVPPPSEIVDDATEDQLAVLASAIRGLGVLQVKGAADLVRPYTGEDSPSLRSAAYVALAYLGKEGMAQAAQGLLDADRDVQGQVAAALADRGPEGQAKILEVLPKLQGDRLRLLDALAKAHLTPAVIGPLVEVVKDGGPETALAARILGELKAKEAVAPLTKYLADPTAVARRDVVRALGKIGDPAAADAVARDLYHDSPDVREAATVALAAIGAERHHESLDALKGDYYRRIREAAAAALNRLSPVAEPHH